MTLYNYENNVIHLFTIREWNEIPDGTILYHLYDNTKSIRKGETDYNPMGTKWALYGIKDPYNHPLKDLFYMFILRGEEDV